MQIVWKSKNELAAMHAAWSQCFPLAECQPVSDEFTEAVEVLRSFRARFGVPEDRFWERLMVLSVDSEGSRDHADRVMTHCLGADSRPDALASDFASAIRGVVRAFTAAFPKFENDMRLRIAPLQQLWEAYGPGLLRLIGRQTAPESIVGSAEVLLVQPISGGAGYPHLMTNRCHIEALLTNPEPLLPETIRLAWLLSQLDFERPVYSERINPFWLRKVAGFAMVPPALLAAQDLELCHYDASTVQRALELWRLAPVGNKAAAEAQLLMTWWETFDHSRPEWTIAMTGLERMLRG